MSEKGIASMEWGPDEVTVHGTDGRLNRFDLRSGKQINTGNPKRSSCSSQRTKSIALTTAGSSGSNPSALRASRSSSSMSS